MFKKSLKAILIYCIMYLVLFASIHIAHFTNGNLKTVTSEGNADILYAKALQILPILLTATYFIIRTFKKLYSTNLIKHILFSIICGILSVIVLEFNIPFVFLDLSLPWYRTMDLDSVAVAGYFFIIYFIFGADIYLLWHIYENISNNS